MLNYSEAGLLPGPRLSAKHYGEHQTLSTVLQDPLNRHATLTSHQAAELSGTPQLFARNVCFLQTSLLLASKKLLFGT